MIAAGLKAFIPFPKPSQGLEKCQRWILACSREYFTVENITRNTYICALHWPGEKGPTDEFPDPLKANFTKKEKEKASFRKRRSPLARSRTLPGAVPQKRQRLISDEDSFSSEQEVMDPPSPEIELEREVSQQVPAIVIVKGLKQFSKYLLSAKIDTMLLKNEVALMRGDPKTTPKVVSSISFEAIANNSALMKHFVGLTAPQFEALYNFLNCICPLDSLTFLNCKEPTKAGNGQKAGPESQFSTREQLFSCILRLRRGFTIKTMAILVSSEYRPVKESTIRKFFTTYIQLMYKVFRDMETVTFPTRDQMQGSLPKVFKTMKNIRCIVDCTEFRVEMPRDYAQQGNTYSSYKHSNTFKCLIAVTPNGSACFVSDLFEGDIDDMKIFQESGIMKHIRPNDLILADRGFTVQHLLNHMQAEIKI